MEDAPWSGIADFGVRGVDRCRVPIAALAPCVGTEYACGSPPDLSLREATALGYY